MQVHVSMVQRSASVHVQVNMFKVPQVCRSIRACSKAHRCAGPGEHVHRPAGVHVQVSMFTGLQVCTGRHKQWEEQELGLDRHVGKR